MRWLARSGSWLALPLFAGCASHTTTRTIRVNAVMACAPDPADMAVFEGMGDFPSSPSPSTIPVSQTGQSLDLLPNVQGILVDIDAGPDAAFWGIADVPPSGDVDVLVWSKLAPCQMSGSPVAVQGESLGLVDPRHALFIAGGNTPFLIDLTTGRSVPVSPLQSPRSQATVTPFGSGALVAGGSVATPSGLYIEPTTEVFTPGDDGASGDFMTSTALQVPRAGAGALVLPTGETLLVGGLFQAPDMLNSTMEKVSRTGSAIVSAKLKTARTSPTVLRLANGQIFVGAGAGANGTPLSSGEWFDAGLTSPLGTIDLNPTMTGADAGAPTPSAQVLFASLEGGAVLAVVAGAGGNKVVVLPPCDTTQTQCTTPQPAGTLSAQLGMNAALFSAAHSAPVLWTGTAWLRWDPWAAHFVALSQADAGTSASGPAGYANLAADPGLALWVSARGTFNGYRYDTRGPFVNDIPIGPSSTAPDRINVAGQGPTVGWGAMGLTIGGGAKVFVTDATFDDVTVKVTMANALADVVFRDDRGCEYEIGGAVPTSVPPCTVSDLSPCDFASLGDGEQEVLEVARRGGNITVTTSGKQAPTCAPHFPQGARLSVGFHGGSSASLLSDLSVSRGP